MYSRDLKFLKSSFEHTCILLGHGQSKKGCLNPILLHRLCTNVGDKDGDVKKPQNLVNLFFCMALKPKLYDLYVTVDLALQSTV